MFRRRELDAPDPFEEMCRQSFEKMIGSFRGKNDADIQTSLLSFQKMFDIYPGLLFWILVDSDSPEKLFQHVRNVTIDNFVVFCSLLQTVCEKKFSTLNIGSLKKVFFLVDELIGMEITAVDPCLAALCRQIPSGSSSPRTLANFSSIFNIVKKNRVAICSKPQLLSSIMYHFVRILPDLGSDQKLFSGLGAFLSQLISEYPSEWQAIGRDAVRVLSLSMQSYSPLKAHYDASLPMLDIQTSSSFLQSRLTPDMEEKINFVLSEVALGSQQRYLTWFMTKFIRNADSMVFDLIRYLCSVGRQKLPSWVILGWLVKMYQQSSLISQISRCILYDFIFYRSSDDPQRLEPGFLLMLNSVRGYQDITQLLLESLIECSQSFDPAALCPQIRTSIETALTKAALVAGISSLSPLFVSANVRSSLVSLFPKAFSTQSQPSSSPSSPSLKRTPSPSSSPLPSKIAKNASDSQSLLSRILSRLPISLKEVFSTLFVVIYNNEVTDDPEHQISAAITSIISYISSNEVRDESAHQIISSLAELLKRQLCTGIFRPSRVLFLVFKTAKDSPTFLSQLRSADIQFGFHVLDWARMSTENTSSYLQMISAANCTIADDIAVCRTTCPLHTSTLLLFAFETLLKHCSDPAAFSYLISSCSPAELSQLSNRIAMGKASLISPEFSDEEKVRIAAGFCSTLNTLPHFQQSLGWTVLANALTRWKPGLIYEFTRQYLATFGTRSISAYELEGISSIWKTVPPCQESVKLLSELSAQFEENLIHRVTMYWVTSHTAMLSRTITEMISYPQCKVFLKVLSQIAEHPAEWDEFVNILKSNVTFLERFVTSELYQNSRIRWLFEEASRSEPVTKTMSSDIDHIDMDGWASFAST